MKNKDPERNFVAWIKGRLDESIDAMDTETAAHLAKARERALGMRRKPRHMPFHFGLPAAGLAALGIVVMALSFNFGRRAGVLPNLLVDDVEIVTAADDMDLFENLDFYSWIASEGQKGDG